MPRLAVAGGEAMQSSLAVLQLGLSWKVPSWVLEAGLGLGLGCR